MNNKIWWYQKDGQQYGPYSKEEIEFYKSNGVINGETLMWKIGMANWQSLDTINLDDNFNQDKTQSIKDVTIQSQNLIYRLLESFDNGDFFRKAFYIIYIIQAFSFWLFPLFIIYSYVSDYDTNNKPSYFIGFIILLIITIFLAFISFTMWWHRSKKVKNLGNNKDEFSVTPLIAHFIQTIGETYSLNISLGGSFILLLIIIITPNETKAYLPEYVSFMGIILFVLIGFIILIISRLISETIRAITAIANNTKK